MQDESKLPTVLRRHLPPNLEKIRYGTYDKDHKDYAVHLYLKENDIRVNEEGSDIVEFLRGKNILVTGATGFLGKALVEKLLRCCKNIGTIYIILRTKNGKDPQERIGEYLDNWVFYKLRQIYPNCRDKVVGISGDFEQDGIGLTEESRTILKEHVNIIYHVAATIRLDEKLKKAVKVNLQGTQEIISLAKECKRLDVFVYISTAFSNCQEKVIKEEFYQPLLDPYKLITVVNALPDAVVDQITPGLLGTAPNTYAFTKQITEDIVRREAVGISTCVHRPSMVTGSVREPLKSWVDNIFGPVGLMQATAHGLLHVMLGNPKGRSDMVPVDYVINSCIASSYRTAQDRQLDKAQIFNCTSSNEIPVTWGKLSSVAPLGQACGSMVPIMKPFIRVTSFYYPWYWLLSLLLHTIPAYVIDFVAVALGKKPLLTAAYRKIKKIITLLSYFTLNEWTFVYSNTTKLWDSLSETDKNIFPFDMKSLDWQDYFATYLVTMREFVIGDFLDSLEAGRKHLWRLDLTFYIAVTTLVALSVYFLLNTVFFFIPVTIISVILYYQFTPAF